MVSSVKHGCQEKAGQHGSSCMLVCACVRACVCVCCLLPEQAHTRLSVQVQDWALGRDDELHVSIAAQ